MAFLAAALLASACAAGPQIASQPARIAYPSAPPRVSQQTEYTQQLRERLAREAGGSQAPVRSSEEPIEETLRRLYP